MMVMMMRMRMIILIKSNVHYHLCLCKELVSCQEYAVLTLYFLISILTADFVLRVVFVLG
jgi:hypothetical protein